MAKQTRQKKSASATRPAAKPAKSSAPSAKPAKATTAKSTKAAPKRTAAGSGRAAPKGAVKAAAKPARPQPAPAKAAKAATPPPAPPPRKPGYYEALAMYESGVRALQRHDYPGAAVQFSSIIERYPEERELQERSLLYLRVCERETARRPATPQTPQERVYAATVALNAGDTAGALDHLRQALTGAPDSDHAHYIMSVALASRGDSGQALEHLRQAISLNPENRALARQDPDLEPVRGREEFRELLDASAGSARNRARKKR